MHLNLKILMLAAIAAVAILGLKAPLQAAELVMFEAPGCPYCMMWKEELGPIYPKTPEGSRAPLRKVTISNQKGMSGLEQPIIHTPTFVLMDHGKEIGRIRGYAGDEFFWTMLDDLLDKLPKTGS